ncbi:MAG: CBS domain-containing protein [Salibacteraceae bacterium]
MRAKELIVEDIPAIPPSFLAAQALDLMDEYKLTHLPVVENNVYLGMVSEDGLLDAEDPTGTLEPLRNQLNPNGVSPEDHVFEVIRALSNHQLSAVPVITQKRQYLGTTTVQRLMQVIAEMPVVEGPGGILILELNVNDYSLSEIARLVENNDAKILGSFITRSPDSTKMELTLKINRPDLQAIQKTFERFDYTITDAFDQSDAFEDLKSRYDLLMNYLNM